MDKAKFLVVEDEIAVRQATLRALEVSGFEGIGAQNGIEALEECDKQSFDCIITDLRMPDMHGYDFINELSKREDLPLIIVLTAVTDPRVELDLYTRGVADVVYKPVKYDRFMAKVKSLLRLKSKTALPLEESKAMATAKSIKEVRESLQQELKTIQSNFSESISKLQQQEALLEKNYLGSIRMFANLLEQNGVSEGSHSVRVETFSGRLGKFLGFGGLELRGLVVAALLHEIGMFGLSDKIRARPPWELEERERLSYQRYPEIGASLVAQIPHAKEITDWVESHAENYDGSGFPRGLSGKSIPIQARIIRIADGVDTHLMHSPTSEAKIRSAEIHLKESKGSLYDPDLVEKTLKHLADILPENLQPKVVKIRGKDLVPGMTLAQDLIDRGGLCLAKRGLVVTDSMAIRLKRTFIESSISIFEGPAVPE